VFRPGIIQGTKELTMTTIPENRIIDPRGPRRRVTHVSPREAQHTRIECECGHIRELNPAFDYRFETHIHCYACREAPDNVREEGRP
jgi:hypothetical protein